VCWPSDFRHTVFQSFQETVFDLINVITFDPKHRRDIRRTSSINRNLNEYPPIPFEDCLIIQDLVQCN